MDKKNKRKEAKELRAKKHNYVKSGFLDSCSSVEKRWGKIETVSSKQNSVKNTQNINSYFK
jgi:hypothetical protein